MSHPRESKTGSLSFSDQISSRLQRWVRRTTAKTRDGDTQRVRKTSKQDVKSDNLNVKERTEHQSRSVIPRESRTMQELEDALKDLIDNCVTNTAITAPSSTASDSGSCSGSEITQGDTGSIGEPTNIKLNGITSAVQRKESGESGCKDTKNAGDYELTSDLEIEVTLDCDSKYLEDFDHIVHCKRDSLDHNRNISSKDKRTSEEGRNLNHPSNGIEIFDTLPSNVNKGLSTGTNIAKKKLSVSKTGKFFLHFGNKSKNSEAEQGGETNPTHEHEEQKPPLRRIQSEGDTMVPKLTFKDSDVDAFAETCIRHAQKKRLSEVGYSEYDPNFLLGLRKSEDANISPDSPLHKSSQESLSSKNIEQHDSISREELSLDNILNDVPLDPGIRKKSIQNTAKETSFSVLESPSKVSSLGGIVSPKKTKSNYHSSKDSSSLSEESSLITITSNVHTKQGEVHSSKKSEENLSRSKSSPRDIPLKSPVRDQQSSSEESSSSIKVPPLSPRRRELPSIPRDNVPHVPHASPCKRASYLSVLPEEHKANRTGSLSLPMDFSKRAKTSPKKSPGLNNPGSSKSLPSSPKLVNTTSPQFRKFPCQPVFYVPDASPESQESRNLRRKHRGRSLTDSNTEYLI